MADAADYAGDYQERLIADGLAAQQASQVVRPKQGNDTNCRVCGYPIGAERLRVIPHAVTCTPCQSSLE